MPLIIAAPTPTSTGSVTPKVQWRLHTPDGGSFGLSGDSFPRAQPGAQGLDAPPLSVYDAEVASAGGTYLGRRIMSRDVLLPIVMYGDSDDEWATARRQLMSAFLTEGECELQVTLPDQSSRSLFARYMAGLESPRDGEQGAVRYARYGIQLRAHDPYWYGSRESITWVEAASGVDFFPGPPFELEPGNVFGAVTIPNGGQTEVWPEWHIEGPVSSATFTGAGGDVWKFNDALLAGESVTVKTDPRVPLASRVVDDSGTSRWGDIAGSSDPFAVFWPLEVGSNDVTVSAAGTSSATKITVSYRLAWWTW